MASEIGRAFWIDVIGDENTGFAQSVTCVDMSRIVALKFTASVKNPDGTGDAESRVDFVLDSGFKMGLVGAKAEQFTDIYGNYVAQIAPQRVLPQQQKPREILVPNMQVPRHKR